MSSNEADPQPHHGDAADKATPAPGRPVSAPRQTERPDPTRYGDWEKGGRCIDF